MRKRFLLFVLTVIFAAGVMTDSAFSQVTGKDEKSVWVTAHGWGKKVADTKMDALRSGIEMVVRDMFTTGEEKSEFLRQRESFLADVEKYVFKYRIKRKILQKGRRGKKKYNMTMTLELLINKEELRKTLEDRGIIVSSRALQKKLDNFTLMPYVDTVKSSKGFADKKDLVYAKVGSFLQNQHIPFIGEEEAKKIEDYEEIIALEYSGSAASGEEDLMLQLARNTRADFYIKIVGHVGESMVEGTACFKVSASITVYTVMTGENIASQTGYGRPLSLSSPQASIAAGIEEAISSAMGDVMNKLRLFWKDYVKEGRPYKLIFYDYDFNQFARIRRHLKNMVSRVKLLKMAGNYAAFMVWYSGTIDDLMFEIPGRIELNLKKDPVILGNTLRFFRKTRGGT